MRHPPLVTLARPLLVALALAMTGSAMAQDPLLGSFSDGQLLLQMQGGNGQYGGQLSFQGQTYAFTAQGNAQRLDGSFQAGNDRFPFQAALQGDAMLFQTGGQTYVLQRQAAAAPTQAPQPANAAGFLRPGMQLTYSQAVASHPGVQGGPEARGVGGEGYIVINILEMTERGCLAQLSNYAIHPLDRSLSSAGGGPIVDQSGGCGEYWLPPASLQAMQERNDGTTSVRRGPYQHGNQTFQAVIINTALQGGFRNEKIYDSASGLMLGFSEGTGAMNWGAGDAPVASSSGVNQLLEVRQVNMPWMVNEALPAHLQQLQQLSYRGTIVESLPGITMWDTSTETQIEMVIDVQQRAPTYLVARSTNSITMLGVPMTPVNGTVLLTANGSYYIPPAALAALRPGQLLDQNTIVGLRLTVESVQQGRVVLLTEGAGYSSRSVYDMASGLLIEGRNETRDSSKISVLSMQFVGSR